MKWFFFGLALLVVWYFSRQSAIAATVVHGTVTEGSGFTINGE